MAQNKKKRQREPGGGRKTIYAAPLIKTSLQLTQAHIDYLMGQSKKGSLPDGARIVIDRDMAREEKAET